MLEGGLRRLPDLLVIAQEEWDEVERRNQLLIRALAQRNPGTRFLFAERPLRPREARQWRWPRARQVEANVWAVRPLRPLPDRASRGAADRIEAAQLRRVVASLGLQEPLAWSQDPRADGLLDRLPVAGLIYDLTDDWAAFEPTDTAQAAMRSQIDGLIARADLVLACSRALEADARRLNDRVEYLPNAVEDPAGDAQAAAEVARPPGPRLGYAGTLHSSRLDVDLLVAAALLRPDWSFAFLGPDLLEDNDRNRLWALPNTHHLGVVPHSQVRAYLAGFDLCLLPNRDTPFTRSLDPLKLYEYLAAGKPIVATPVGETSDLRAHIALAATADELVTTAEQAFAAEAPERPSERKAAVAGATWDARAQTIEDALGCVAREAADCEVSVVIVSFNTRELLARCLAEVHAQADVGMQVIVVDNASTDGSPQMVRSRFPEVELIELGDNAGFARANNVAFATCRGRHVLLLNSDAFLTPGTIRTLLDVAERHPSAGAVGPRLLNPGGSLQRSAWPFPHPIRLGLEAVGLHRPLRRIGLLEDLGTWNHDEERTVDFLIGACLLLRRQALEEVGGFDETFWLYGEEADLQRRMAARGWKVVFTPSSEATHVGGGSSDSESVTRLTHFYAGQMRFLRKHGGLGAWPAARVALVVNAVLRRRWAVAAVALRLR